MQTLEYYPDFCQIFPILNFSSSEMHRRENRTLPFHSIASLSHDKQKWKPVWEKCTDSTCFLFPCINFSPFTNYTGQTDFLGQGLRGRLGVGLHQTNSKTWFAPEVGVGLGYFTASSSQLSLWSNRSDAIIHWSHYSSASSDGLKILVAILLSKAFVSGSD